MNNNLLTSFYVSESQNFEGAKSINKINVGDELNLKSSKFVETRKRDLGIYYKGLRLGRFPKNETQFLTKLLEYNRDYLDFFELQVERIEASKEIYVGLYLK